MKSLKFIFTLSSLLIGLQFAKAEVESGNQKFSPVQIQLMSQPLDIYGDGQLATVFISGLDVNSEYLSFAGAFSNTLNFTVDLNTCHTSTEGSVCTEMGSITHKARLQVSTFSTGFANHSQVVITLFSQDGQQILLKGKNGAIELSLQIETKSNDPGIPSQILYLKAKDKAGVRKVLLSPRLSF